jgi:hypothetical protein
MKTKKDIYKEVHTQIYAQVWNDCISKYFPIHKELEQPLKSFELDEELTIIRIHGLNTPVRRQIRDQVGNLIRNQMYEN